MKASRSTALIALISIGSSSAAWAKPASKTDCPFARPSSTTGQALHDQLKALALQMTPSTQAQNNGRCNELMTTYEGSSAPYANLARAYHLSNGQEGTVSAETLRSQIALGDAISGLMNAGCQFADPKSFFDVSMQVLDSMSNAVSATGFFNPAGFLAGAGMSAASRLGLAIARWLKKKPQELENLKSAMQNDSFRDRLCTYRSLAYKVDEMDPGLENIQNWQKKLSDEKTALNAKLANADYSCFRSLESDSNAILEIQKQLQPVITGLSAGTSPSDPAARCDELRYALSGKQKSIHDLSERIGCGTDSPASPRTADFCSRWKEVSGGLTAFNCLGDRASVERFNSLSAFLINNLSAVSLEYTNAMTQKSPDAFAQFRQLRESQKILDAELARMKEIDANQTPHDLVQLNSMIKDLGGLLLGDGFYTYSKWNRDGVKHSFDMAKKSIKVRKSDDRCDSAKAAQVEFRMIQPRLRSVAQICETLGADGKPNPPFNTPARDFNSLTGEERRLRVDGRRLSPLQQVCFEKQDPSEAEIASLQGEIKSLWESNCKEPYRQ